MTEEHLDFLAVAPRLPILGSVPETSDHITGWLMHASNHLAKQRLGSRVMTIYLPRRAPRLQPLTSP